MQRNVTDFILPYFEKVKTMSDMFCLLENKKLVLQPLGKLILYAKFGKTDKAQKEYDLLLENKSNPYFLENVKFRAKKLGLQV